MNADYPAPSQVRELRQLWQGAFADSDPFLDRFFTTAYAPQRCRCITEKGIVAAALYWFDCTLAEEKYAYLYAVATAPRFQGQGLCRRLMEDTHALLQSQGYAGTILVPGAPGLFTMYERMGYWVMSGMDNLCCCAGSPVPVKEASVQEYAAARRKYLPHRGVVQEGENLIFLASTAKLYTGEDFVLAAAVDGTRLDGLELLGNASAAPGILASLKLSEGIFRTPGNTPFAMYRPLRDTPSPGYFGIAFD